MIFYTGTQGWEQLPSIAELVQGSELLAPYLPHLKPLTINLLELTAETLYGDAGFFGAVLHVFQQREQNSSAFRSRTASLFAAPGANVGGATRPVADPLELPVCPDVLCERRTGARV